MLILKGNMGTHWITVRTRLWCIYHMRIGALSRTEREDCGRVHSSRSLISILWDPDSCHCWAFTVDLIPQKTRDCGGEWRSIQGLSSVLRRKPVRRGVWWNLFICPDFRWVERLYHQAQPKPEYRICRSVAREARMGGLGKGIFLAFWQMDVKWLPATNILNRPWYSSHRYDMGQLTPLFTRQEPALRSRHHSFPWK